MVPQAQGLGGYILSVEGRPLLQVPKLEGVRLCLELDDAVPDPVGHQRAPLLEPGSLAALKVDVLLGVGVGGLEFDVLLEVAEVGLELLDLLLLLLAARVEGVLHLPALLDEGADRLFHPFRFLLHHNLLRGPLILREIVEGTGVFLLGNRHVRSDERHVLDAGGGGTGPEGPGEGVRVLFGECWQGSGCGLSELGEIQVDLVIRLPFIRSPQHSPRG